MGMGAWRCDCDAVETLEDALHIHTPPGCEHAGTGARALLIHHLLEFRVLVPDSPSPRAACIHGHLHSFSPRFLCRSL